MIKNRELNPDEDGITHINIYSKGKTELGKALTNLSDRDFDWQGKHFGSLEAMWFWLLSDKKRDDFIPLGGFAAKKLSKTLKEEDCISIDENFKNQIKEGFQCKLKAHKDIIKMLYESELPFTHYYYYGKDGKYKVMNQDKHYWQCEEFERLRLIIKDFYANKTKKPKI